MSKDLIGLLLCFNRTIKNLHFTLGYSLLKIEMDYGVCSVAGLAKGRRTLFSAIPHSSELKEKQRSTDTTTNRQLRCGYISRL